MLRNPKLVLMAQDCLPSANYEVSGNPNASVNPAFTPCTWLNTLTGCKFLCTDNTPDANVWIMISGFRGALVTKTTVQAIANDTETAITWDSEINDSDEFHEGVTNPTRFTIPTGVSKVFVSASISFASNVNGIRAVYIKRNGATAVGLPYDTRSGNASGISIGISSAVIDVIAGDYFELWVKQTSGGSLNAPWSAGSTTAWFSIKVVQ